MPSALQAGTQLRGCNPHLRFEDDVGMVSFDLLDLDSALRQLTPAGMRIILGR